MKLETLAQAVARLDDEVQANMGTDRAWLFVAYITNLKNYDSISDAVDDCARVHNQYVGEKRYIAHETFAEIRVSIAPSAEVYRQQFGVK